MKMRSLVLTVLAAVAVSAWLPTPALAIRAFKDAFEAKYVKADSTAPADVALAAAVRRAKCTICHAPDDKCVRNAYGQALDQLLDREKDQDDAAAIAAALEKVANMKSDPKDSNSPTFGERCPSGERA
jgi:cytochrome c2